MKEIDMAGWMNNTHNVGKMRADIFTALKAKYRDTKFTSNIIDSLEKVPVTDNIKSALIDLTDDANQKGDNGVFARPPGPSRSIYYPNQINTIFEKFAGWENEKISQTSLLTVAACLELGWDESKKLLQKPNANANEQAQVKDLLKKMGLVQPQHAHGASAETLSDIKISISDSSGGVSSDRLIKIRNKVITACSSVQDAIETGACWFKVEGKTKKVSKKMFLLPAADAAKKLEKLMEEKKRHVTLQDIHDLVYPAPQVTREQQEASFGVAPMPPPHLLGSFAPDAQALAPKRDPAATYINHLLNIRSLPSQHPDSQKSTQEIRRLISDVRYSNDLSALAEKLQQGHDDDALDQLELEKASYRVQQAPLTGANAAELTARNEPSLAGLATKGGKRSLTPPLRPYAKRLELMQPGATPSSATGSEAVTSATGAMTMLSLKAPVGLATVVNPPGSEQGEVDVDSEEVTPEEYAAFHQELELLTAANQKTRREQAAAGAGKYVEQERARRGRGERGTALRGPRLDPRPQGGPHPIPSSSSDQAIAAMPPPPPQR